MHETVRPEPSRLYRWLVLIFISLAMFGSYYAYDGSARWPTSSSSNWDSPIRISAAARHLQLRQHFYRADRRHHHRPHRLRKVFDDFRRAVHDRPGHYRIVRATLGHGGRAAHLRHGRRITDRRGHHRAGPVVQRQRTQLRFRPQSHHRAPGHRSPHSTPPPGLARAYANWRWPFLIALGPRSFASLAPSCTGSWKCRRRRTIRLGEASTDKVVFADLFKFGVSYWLHRRPLLHFLLRHLPLPTFAVNSSSRRHGHFAGNLRRLPVQAMLTALLLAMIATPLFGLLVDRVGKRAWFMMFGSLLLMPVYLMMAYTASRLYVPDGSDGSGVLADPGGDVAFGRLHRRPIPTGHGLWADDHDPANRLLPASTCWSARPTITAMPAPTIPAATPWACGFFRSSGFVGLALAIPASHPRDSGPTDTVWKRLPRAKSDRLERLQIYQFPKIATLNWDSVYSI